MENPNKVEEINKKSTGPRTEEGKRRSSQNAIKHALFAKEYMLPGDNREDFEALHDALKENHKPRTSTEECMVHRLAVIQWKLLRADRLEAMSIEQSIETRNLDGKNLTNFSLYSQRLNREFQSTLKSLHVEQAPRLEAHFQDWRVAVLLHDHNLRKKYDWDPASDGFVFSKEELDRQLLFNQRWTIFMKEPHIYATTKYMDERFGKLAL